MAWLKHTSDKPLEAFSYTKHLYWKEAVEHTPLQPEIDAWCDAVISVESAKAISKSLKHR